MFNTKYFKLICQVCLLTPLKKCCYISSTWLAVNEARMSIKGKGVDVNNMEVPNEDLSLRISKFEEMIFKVDIMSADIQIL